MTSQFPIVDADGHLEEVHINWKERVPERYRAMAPEQRPASDSHLRLMLEGKPWPKQADPASASADPIGVRTLDARE